MFKKFGLYNWVLIVVGVFYIVLSFVEAEEKGAKAIADAWDDGFKLKDLPQEKEDGDE
jgi:hypothetical protein